MNAAEVEVVAALGAVLLGEGCIVLWLPLPWGLGLRRPRLRPIRFWLYPRSLRERGIV